MTDEEIAEYNRLCNEYNALVAQNNALREEIALGIENCYIVAGNIDKVGKSATDEIKFVSGELDEADEVVERLHALLVDLTEHYFLFKNMSEASKKLSGYTDEYNEKYRLYNDLRRITLGYIIGLDSSIVSNETLRKKVEKIYLANTDYWLSYAIMAVMLWASDEQEAANRALNKAISMDCYKACVFFMLVNLRFGRTKVAQNWYLTLLEKTDVGDMQDEWQFVLHAYLIGAMKGDEEFNTMVESCFDKLIEQTKATNVDFGKKVATKAADYAKSSIHVTESAYPALNESSPDYKEMLELQSEMEKIGELARSFDKLFNEEDDPDVGLFEQIEDILYNLINSYDEAELKVVKELKLNEAIMAAKGDMALATRKFQEQYPPEEDKKTFGDLLLKWAFTEDRRDVSVAIRKFSIAHLKDRISKGMGDYFEEKRDEVREKYKLRFPLFGEEVFETECGEDAYQSVSEKIGEQFNKKKLKFIVSDKMFRIFCLMGAGALVILAIAALAAKSSAFPVFLVLGIVLGVVSGFLVWRRVVDLGKMLTEKYRLTLVKLQSALDEMREWRKATLAGYEELDNLRAAIEMF